LNLHCARKGNGLGFFGRSLKRFLPINLGEAEDKTLNYLSPRSEFSKPLEKALDGSKTGLDKAKRGLDHFPVFQSANVLPKMKYFHERPHHDNS
jgi:hypothetical protein